jgi:hypothetical protein
MKIVNPPAWTRAIIDCNICEVSLSYIESDIGSYYEDNKIKYLYVECPICKNKVVIKYF